MSSRKLLRSRTDRVIAGVCGGVAEHSEVDANLVRIFWAISILAAGIGLLAYLICWVLMPEEAPEHSGVGSGRGIERKKDMRLTTGWLLIILGLVLLAGNYLEWLEFQKLWPLLLIAAGIYMLGRQARSRRSK